PLSRYTRATVLPYTTLFRSYERDHLDQVLATFGLILFFNELIAILWGRSALYASIPRWLSGHVLLLPGVRYPVYRALIIAVGLLDRKSTRLNSSHQIISYAV